MALRLVLACLAALVLAPAASAQSSPQNLHAFLLKATEPEEPTRTFARTPAFAWNPVNGATGYEFQLSSSRTFAENAIVWENENLFSPVTTIPLTLPWTTGAPYSFYARVRAKLQGGRVTGWGERYGFRIRAPQAPASLSSNINPRPGMVRWTPVEGATAYEVTFQYSQGGGIKKKIKSATTAADLREYYTLHNEVPNFLPVTWRVRAVRELEGKPMNNLPVVSYGPWSTEYTTYEPPLAWTQVDPRSAISRSRAADIEDTDASGAPDAHELVPGFIWNGRYSLPHGSPPVRYGDCPADIDAAFDVTCFLFHVYVYTDEDCVNRVHVSDLVGSPAYVPRLTGPLDFPADTEEMGKVVTDQGYLILEDGEKEGEIFDAGGEQIYPAGLDPDLPPRESTGLRPGVQPDRRSGLWDTDFADGRYYWTVVPAVPRITPDLKIEYHDVEFAESMCQAGELGVFRKTSAPAIERANGIPFLSGMIGNGAIAGAGSDRPQFFGRVVVAWTPAPGAQRYEVQWSRTEVPFRPAGSLKTPSTAAMLQLDTGVWYYRVRGLDETIPGRLQGMTWSAEQYVRIRPRVFTRVRR